MESIPAREHLEALMAAEVRFQEERDRRYAEVATEREKALKIKETADLAALSLAREIQTYKDEKANELRSQIERERGTYCTQGDLKGAVEKMQATIAPLGDYVSKQSGRTGGLAMVWGVLGVVAGLAVAIVSLVTR